MTDIKDLWTYSQWVLQLKPSDAMNIFTHSRRRKSNHKLYIHFDKVIQHLHEDIINNIETYSDIINFDYIQKYLEFIVCGSDGESLNPKYHDELAYLYMKKIEKLNKLENVRVKLLGKSKYNKLLENARAKLLGFLGKSQLISPSKLLQHAKKFQLYDAIVELNKKLNNHKAILSELVIHKKDHKAAIEYCKEATPGSKDRSDRFLELLRLYFGNRTDENVNDNDNIMMKPKHYRRQPIKIKKNFVFTGDFNDLVEIKKNFVFDKEEFFDLGCEILYDYAFDMDYLKVLQLL
eukprot:467355_1